MLITDSFTRADSTSSLGNADTGQAWVAAEGTWGISSNQAYYVSGGSSRKAYIEASTADCTVTVTMSGEMDYGGLMFRYTDANNYNMVYNGPAVGYPAEVRTKVSGTDTVVATFPRMAAGARVRVRMAGSAIQVLVDGVQVYSGTVTANQSATKHGLHVSSTATRFDDFSIAGVAGEAGTATGIAYPAKPASDDFSGAVVLSGTSGSGTIHGLGGTWDSVTPEPAVGAGSSTTPPTYWLTYTPSGPGTFTVGVTKTSCVVEAIDGGQLGVDAFDSGSNGTTNPSLVVNVSTVPFYVRIHEYTSGASATWFNINYTWSFAARVEELQFGAADLSIPITPASFRVNVGNGDPNALVNFAVDGGATLLQIQLDELGVATSVSIPLPSLAAGTHNLTATQTTGGKSSDLDFTVENEPYDYPAAIADDAAPTPVVQTGVVKWVFQDPATGGEQYIFAVNPAKMGSPHMAQVMSSKTTTAPNGQQLTWQGAPKAMEWQISGTLLADTQLDAFERFLNLNRRIYLIDHYSRAWKVSVEGFDPQPKRPFGVIQFLHDYTIRMLVYGEPVQL